MNKNTGIIIGVVVLLIIVAGVYASMGSNDNAMEIKEPMEQKAMEDQEVTEENAMMEKEGASMTDNKYEMYAPEKVMQASPTHDVVLFFRADWCPTCRTLDADINANLSEIPSSLTILDVNYDDSTALKRKYGVTYQHTFVQVDKDGNLIKKWSGSPTLAALLAEVE